MREQYDFSDSKPNPYTKRLKKPITIRLDDDTISYFKRMAESKGLPYQSLINLYLRDQSFQGEKYILTNQYVKSSLNS